MSLKLGTTLADLRKRNGLSQEALAEKMGVSRQAVSKWERGESTPDTDTLIELSNLYNVSLDVLVGNKKEDETPPPKKEKKTKTELIEKGDPIYPGLSAKLLKFPFPLVAVAFYVLSGVTLHLWHPMWLVFLLIPAYYHFAIGMRAKTKKGLLFAIPIFESALILFLILGFLLNLWSVAWILFVAAIIYYWSVAFYVKK